MLGIKTEGHLLENSFFLIGGRSVVLVRPQLIRWGPLTLERNLLFSKSIVLNVNLIRKHSHRNIQNNV